MREMSMPSTRMVPLRMEERKRKSASVKVDLPEPEEGELAIGHKPREEEIQCGVEEILTALTCSSYYTYPLALFDIKGKSLQH